MSGSRLALVTDDPRLATSVQTQIKKDLGLLSFVCKLDTIRDHLRPDTDGVLLLVAATDADCDGVRRLVQEICIQKLPPVVVLLESDQDPPRRELDGLVPYVAARMRLPQDNKALVDFIRQRVNRGPNFTEAASESIEDVISRRLLAYTPSLIPLIERIALAASHDVTVLLTGETGTGKTYMAKLIHDCSPRTENRFLVVPCGALSPNLVESEFFGHTKGAFTGADRPKVGKFAAAGNGTLLLDEIDALGLDQQANLLRVIETGEFEPVGCNETQICTARIIVASNWNLEEAVEAGKFRRDLYYRLNVMSFHLPPLRERVQDIAPLVRGMAARFNNKFNKQLFDIHPTAMAALEAFNWPGNIRQLENAIQQAVLVSSGPELMLHHLPEPIREGAAHHHGTNGDTATLAMTQKRDMLSQKREVTEKAEIHKALVNCGYSRARAASALGISRVTLYKKMKKYNLMNIPLHPASAQ